VCSSATFERRAQEERLRSAAERLLGEIDKVLAPDSSLRPDLRTRRESSSTSAAPSPIARHRRRRTAAIRDLNIVRELDPTLMQVYLDLANIYHQEFQDTLRSGGELRGWG
jgi:hypothetical protein